MMGVVKQATHVVIWHFRMSTGRQEIDQLFLFIVEKKNSCIGPVSNENISLTVTCDGTNSTFFPDGLLISRRKKITELLRSKIEGINTFKRTDEQFIVIIAVNRPHIITIVAHSTPFN